MSHEGIFQQMLQKAASPRSATGVLAQFLFTRIFKEALFSSDNPNEWLVALARAIDHTPEFYYIEFLVRSSSMLLQFLPVVEITEDMRSLVDCCSFIVSHVSLGSAEIYYTSFPPVKKAIKQALDEEAAARI